MWSFPDPPVGAYAVGWRHDPPRPDDRRQVVADHQHAVDWLIKELTWAAIDDPTCEDEEGMLRAAAYVHENKTRGKIEVEVLGATYYLERA